jgi:PAS domain-containing protein
VDANPAVTKLFGYARTQLIDVKFWESDLFRRSDIGESIRGELQQRESLQKSLTLTAESGGRRLSMSPPRCTRRRTGK